MAWGDAASRSYATIDIVLVALRDIEAGEELLADYGDAWEVRVPVCVCT